MNTNKNTKNVFTGSKRLRYIGVTALAAFIAVGLGAVVSAQIATTDKEADLKKGNSVTNKVGDNGRVRPLTPEEAQILADGIKQLVNQSDEGLQQIVEPDGSVSMDLEGRFQNVTLAQKNVDGSVSQACVDNPQSAAKFLGIDPKAFGSPTQAKRAAKPKQAQRDARGDEIE